MPVEVFVSPGGYICGEQTALIQAIEDKRAEPRNRPPELQTNGLWDMPTLVNNVETLAWVPAIILLGEVEVTAVASSLHVRRRGLPRDRKDSARHGSKLVRPARPAVRRAGDDDSRRRCRLAAAARRGAALSRSAHVFYFGRREAPGRL